MSRISITPPYESSFSQGAERIAGLSSDQFTLERNTALRSLASFFVNHLQKSDTYHRVWPDNKPLSYFDGWCMAMQQEIIREDIDPYIKLDSESYNSERVAVHQDAGLINNLAERYIMGDRQFPIASQAAFKFRETALDFYQQRLLTSEANALNSAIGRKALKQGFKNTINPVRALKTQGISYLLRQLAHINPILSLGAPLATRGITRATYEATALIQGREAFDGKQWLRIKLSSEEITELQAAYRTCYEACVRDQALIDTGFGLRNMGYAPKSIDALMESILLLQPNRKFCGIYRPIMAYILFRDALQPKANLHRARPKKIGKK